MRLAWASDIHLNHVALKDWDTWIDQVRQAAADVLVITGDLSEAEDVVFQLRRMGEVIRLPIYFVLGNHDFYGSSIAATRRSVTSLAREYPSLCYLTDAGPVELTPGQFLTGEDGWGDGTEGDYENSPVRLNDFVAIDDFRQVDPIRWPRLMREQGAQSAERLRQKLLALPASADRVIVATHVPPFRDACWYEGQTTDDFWAPFFVCGQVGSVLKRFAFERPEIHLTVLCGHTHHAGTAQLAPNLVVQTAAAEYGAPRVEQVLEL
ncbi:Calcineurin-like phosphoesterase superfamily domain protein [Stieleria maiorica]|uniref:Calcineurin-like phosphoesterase superfamily domain protein n=1 Tax=Stieleria maiorica TaxID=2795974 RepID=A0A5B9M7R3_9BACT|nr:metallophosphoesterase [Stieleria maiorica]QEF96080.1 Calcineurin-like phosphoesterase superfamily domain protein [Stieleria maiorica]